MWLTEFFKYEQLMLFRILLCVSAGPSVMCMWRGLDYSFQSQAFHFLFICLCFSKGKGREDNNSENKTQSQPVCSSEASADLWKQCVSNWWWARLCYSEPEYCQLTMPVSEHEGTAQAFCSVRRHPTLPTEILFSRIRGSGLVHCWGADIQQACAQFYHKDKTKKSWEFSLSSCLWSLGICQFISHPMMSLIFRA